VPGLRSCAIARPAQRLHRLKVIRTEGPLAGQVAEWVAARHLGLRLVPSNVQKIYDAVDRAGRTYQIKGRIVSPPRLSTSFDFRRPLRRFDFMLGVLLSPTFEVLAIVRVSHTAIRRHARRNRNRFSLRWTKRSPDASWICVLYASEELRRGANGKRRGNARA
jgi:hypothetical protein